MDVLLPVRVIRLGFACATFVLDFASACVLRDFRPASVLIAIVNGRLMWLF